MARHTANENEGFNPFGDLIGLRFSDHGDGTSQFTLEVRQALLNPYQVLHGGVLYAMADTAMGAALYTRLQEEEACATIEMKINYLAAVTEGTLTCDARVIHKGKRIAVLESEIMNDGRLVAKAMGTFSIFKR